MAARRKFLPRRARLMRAMPASFASAAVDEVYRSDWGRILATLIGIFNDFDIAEEAAQDAFAAAAQHWPLAGVPDNPRAWLITTARNKALDRLRRRASLEEKLQSMVHDDTVATPEYDLEEIPDERLRLIFTCCHPALAPEVQIALTLRTLCGLETSEIARAFLVPEPTMAQRLARAKKKIREARIPYVVPGVREMSERLEAVLRVIYLLFNEGYAATRGEPLVRADLCAEAIRLARLLRTLTEPSVPAEVLGLLALVLLHDARRAARHDETGDLVLLEHQDRARWNRPQIEEALPLVERALREGGGPYSIQAAIAALHCEPQRAELTDWPQIVRLYDVLEQLEPNPVVSLNRAIAVAMVEGPEAALAIVDRLDLADYHLFHSTRAELLRRLARDEEAKQSYARALETVTNESERRHLQRRLTALGAER